MEIRLTLALPRDELSIPVVRRILSSAMTVLGVSRDSTDDVAVAISEACTNVLEHAPHGAAYEVSVGIDENLCVIEVLDTGSGFDADALGTTTADVSAEQGRGIHLMRAMVDRVRFDRRPERGTIVHLEKQLHWHEGAPIRRAAAGDGAAGVVAAPTEAPASDPLG